MNSVKPLLSNVGLLLAVTMSGSAIAEQPNLVHIIADDLGWNDVSFHGSEIQTPQIDRLANESVILDRFYVTPICSPTRAGVLTGRYPFRFGIWGGVVSPTKRHGLPPSELTAPELLAAAGYQQRAIFGKWHLGLASMKFHPIRHGFTEFYGHYNGAIDYFSRMRFGQLDWHRDTESIHEDGYSTDLIGDASVEFIDRQKRGDPFYLLVAFNAPHSPIQAQPADLQQYNFDPQGPRAPNTDAGISKRENFPEYGERGKGNTVRQTFAAMTSAMDRNVGRILNALDRNGLSENTLVIFHSDNGGDPKHGGDNSPLRGKKFSTWEGGVRVVAMIRWPAALPSGTRVRSVASYVDLLPTQLAAAGQPIPKNLDGVNLLPLLTGDQTPSDRILLLGAKAAVSDRWKLTNGQLFDLNADRSESTDVAVSHPLQFQRLKAELNRFSELTGPPTVSALPKPEQWPPTEWRLPEEQP
ncbi:UNVERIFIED_CONTAM: hypothetical protein GTU68_038970 [Idotea baltica]|nr:hypothetical protein [Idotea baltica]